MSLSIRRAEPADAALVYELVCALADYEKLRHEVDADLTAVRIPLVGVRLDPTPRLSVGVTYRGESKLDLGIDANIKGQVDPSIGGILVPVSYTLSSRSFDAFQPRQVALGTRYQPVDDLQLSLDFVWTNWSSYQSATSRSVADLEIDVPRLEDRVAALEERRLARVDRRDVHASAADVEVAEERLDRLAVIGGGRWLGIGATARGENEDDEEPADHVAVSISFLPGVAEQPREHVRVGRLGDVVIEACVTRALLVHRVAVAADRDEQR